MFESLIYTMMNYSLEFWKFTGCMPHSAGNAKIQNYVCNSLTSSPIQKKQ